MNELYITPITTNLEKYTFKQSNQLYQQTGCIGYLRADFGSSGKEFHSTWNDTCSFFKTEDFSKETPWDDLREVIHPKRPDTILADMGLEKPYFQVFSRKYGFKSDLSIMDLLFNEGPDSILYLKRL